MSGAIENFDEQLVFGVRPPSVSSKDASRNTVSSGRVHRRTYSLVAAYLTKYASCRETVVDLNTRKHSSRGKSRAIVVAQLATKRLEFDLIHKVASLAV